MRDRSLPGRRHFLAGATAVVLILTAAPAAQATVRAGSAPRTGSLVLIGGGLAPDNTQVYG
ncbi:hypothetical protein [Streptomyces nigra]